MDQCGLDDHESLVQGCFGVFRVGVSLQGSQRGEWVQSAQGARRWHSCLGGVAVTDRQNSPDQVSGRQPNPTCWLAAAVSASERQAAKALYTGCIYTIYTLSAVRTTEISFVPMMGSIHHTSEMPCTSEIGGKWL